MRIGMQSVLADARLGIRHDDLADVLLHGLLAAPVVVAEGQVAQRGDGCGRPLREGSLRLPFEDELEWEQLAAEGGGDAGGACGCTSRRTA